MPVLVNKKRTFLQLSLVSYKAGNDTALPLEMRPSCNPPQPFDVVRKAGALLFGQALYAGETHLAQLLCMPEHLNTFVFPAQDSPEVFLFFFETTVYRWL